MFEVGISLRAARDKRGLELDVVQKALRIRRRYLEALESERFELLPGEVYARGFLREYAEFLGLDGSIYVEEYNARFAHHEEHPIAALPTAPPLRRAPALPVLVGVAVALAAVLGLVAWQLSGRGGSTPARAPAQAATGVPAAQKTQAAPRPKLAPVAAAAGPRPAHLVLTAARGDCWVIVRAGSASGPVLYENTLRRGDSLRLTTHRPFWMRVGAGMNLDARVSGRTLTSLPHMTGNLLVGA